MWLKSHHVISLKIHVQIIVDAVYLVCLKGSLEAMFGKGPLIGQLCDSTITSYNFYITIFYITEIADLKRGKGLAV